MTNDTGILNTNCFASNQYKDSGKRKRDMVCNQMREQERYKRALKT